VLDQATRKVNDLRSLRRGEAAWRSCDLIKERIAP
jgi:hypothetical protein